MQNFTRSLEEKKQANLWRTRLQLDERQHATWLTNDHYYLSFINNDYLGLATHPAVISALHEGAAQYGAGSSASPLLGGYHKPHQQLEQALADFTGFERALLFSSGYLANLAVITTLIHKKDIIFEHRLNHASLIDAARFSGASIKRFTHLEQLQQQLSQTTIEKKWIVTDAVFSMDGTIAPLPELIALAKNYEAKIIIDDAHGIGVLGKQGRGTLEHHQQKSDDITMLMASFGKGFGGQGAFVAGNDLLIEYLLQFARGYIYSTALSPALAEANRVSLNLIKHESWRRQHLQNLINTFSSHANQLGLEFAKSATPIQILILRDTTKTLKIAEALKQKGMLVGAIRPPTVAPNSARLRINLSVHHNEQDVLHLLNTLSALLC
jgi:8-amino-7-oxononanoate synthase